MVSKTEKQDRKKEFWKVLFLNCGKLNSDLTCKDSVCEKHSKKDIRLCCIECAKKWACENPCNYWLESK